LVSPCELTTDKSSNLYITDCASEHILELSASTHKLSVFAGTGAGGYSGDGEAATKATFNHPQGIEFSPSGSELYVADSRNNVIRSIDMSSGIIHTIAGTGAAAGPGDAETCPKLVLNLAATKTALCNPFGLAVDAKGDIYVVNGGSGQILKLSQSTGKITLVAGTGNYGYTGDGGKAVDANFSWILGVALDSDDNVYITDSGNCAIRKVTASTGVITSLVGVPASAWSGTCGLSGDGGPASSAQIRTTEGVAVDKNGNVFLSDTGNDLVRVIAASNGKIYTVAGSYANGGSISGYTGNGGPATKATLFAPQGVAIDSAGDLYFSETDNFVVRKVTQPVTAFVP
jgi:sugar lactone lactonase YvrE